MKKSTMVGAVLLGNISVAASMPVVQGKVISWPDDGWYQVQRADNYVSVCEGSTSCTVEPGAYIVINHDSGVRTPVSVTANSTPGPATPTVGAPNSNPTIDPGPVVTGNNVAQLPIIGTALPGNSVSSINYTVDGVSMFADDGFALFALSNSGIGGTTHPDFDGDGIPEVSIRLREPNDQCASTTVYIPSRQARSASLNSANLSAYTRIRKVVRQSANGFCNDDSPGFSRIGDLNGDGLAEFLHFRTPGENIIIDGSVPAGTQIEPDIASRYARVIASGTEVWAVGDVDGDGLDDLGVGFTGIESGAGFNFECGILKGGANSLAIIDAKNLQQYQLLGLWGVNAPQNIDCPTSRAKGDFNGDGATDLVLRNYENFTDRVVYGGSGVFIDDNAINSADQVEIRCASGVICDYESRIDGVGDFDSDGYDDVALPVDNRTNFPFIQRPNALILYGSANGLPSFSVNNPPLDSQVTKVYGSDLRRAVYLYGIGDANGDGASDFSAGGGAVLFGTSGNRPAFLSLNSLNGANGLRWVQDNIGETNFGDWNSDGVTDYFLGGKYVPGYAPFRTANDVESVFIWQGQASSTVRWSVPQGADGVTAIRVVFNDRSLAVLDRPVTRYRIDHALVGSSGSLRLQSLNMNGDVIGESVRWVGPLSAEYNSSVVYNEQTADGRLVPGINYELRAASYGPALSELFWNATKRFVLIWKDDEIIARSEGNSFLLKSDEHESGQYFVTIDYFGEMPADTKPFEFTGGTLRRSNVVDIELF